MALLVAVLLGSAPGRPVFAAEAASNAPKPVFEEWALIVIDGKTCGFGSTITTENDTPSGPQYLTVHQEKFVLLRMGTALTVTDTSKVTEDADGGVLNFDQTTDAGSVVESGGLRDGDDMVVSSRGQTQRYHLPRLDALGPEAVRRLTLQVPLRPGQAIPSPPSAANIRRLS